MIIRTITAAAAAAAIAAGAASAGTSTHAAFRMCGTIPIAGKSWVVVARGVPCTDARALIRKLAALPGSGSRCSIHAIAPCVYPGTYLGMRCLNAPKSAKPAINCLSLNGAKQVTGAVHA
jgi:hypothetical protein